MSCLTEQAEQFKLFFKKGEREGGGQQALPSLKAGPCKMGLWNIPLIINAKFL